MTISEQDQLSGLLLHDVSRSFYLTLRVLPIQIRPQISLAYLLARASDTIADTMAVPREKRMTLLRQWQQRQIAGLVELAENQALPAERVLLRRLGECVRLLETFSVEDQALIGELHRTIITGQMFDLEKFPGETEKDLVALANDGELDRYTYLVAGCVGEFWTKMCVAHLKGLEGWKDGRMEELGVRFGKGLQLVNILRDMPRDLRIGRCYLPVGDPRPLLHPANFRAIRPVYERWLDAAVEHLDAGWMYTMQIPVSQKRVRLACIWPIWIGLKTIARLRAGNPLDPTQRIKISRGAVYGVMLRSFLLCRNDAALSDAYRKLRDAASSSSARR